MHTVDGILALQIIFTRMLDSSVYMAINWVNKVTNTLKLV